MLRSLPDPQVCLRWHASVGDNQDVVDASHIIFLAIRPQISEEVITGLQFRPGQHVVRLIATLWHEKLAAWIRVPAKVTRAIPWHTVADQGMTAIFPPDVRVAELFSGLDHWSQRPASRVPERSVNWIESQAAAVFPKRSLYGSDLNGG